jgi:hypothetical protein
LVAKTLEQEGLVKEIFKPAAPFSCDGIREAWVEWSRAQLSSSCGGDRTQLALKGCKTLFDEPCAVHDEKLKDEVYQPWVRRVSDVKVTKHLDIVLLKSWVRKTISRWRYHPSPESVYIPDQRGCFETTSGKGGTFATGLGEEQENTALCRLGFAKTKGKMRVVTMQGALAKRLFRPVHKSLYDFLSQEFLVVRGQVTDWDFEDLRASDGDSYISGDYTGATDYLHADAVRAVVDVIAEHLPTELGRELAKSFRPVCRVKGGKYVAVERGAMMGNLVSFPVLCLINRYCVTSALEATGRPERCLINGDDSCFPGSERTFLKWVEITARFGLVVNKEKTKVSPTKGELNSHIWEKGSGLVRKLCFGFLSKQEWQDQPLAEDETRFVSPFSALFDTVKLLKPSTACFLLTSFPVRRLFRIAAPACSEVPRRWFCWLRKKRFFRESLLSGSGQQGATNPRALDVVYGPFLDFDDEERVVKEEREAMVDHVVRWQGVKMGKQAPACPLRPEKRSPDRGVKISRGPVVGRRLWIRPVLARVRAEEPWILQEEDDPAEPHFCEWGRTATFSRSWEFFSRGFGPTLQGYGWWEIFDPFPLIFWRRR